MWDSRRHCKEINLSFMFILGQYYGTDPRIYLNDNTDLPGFMLVVNISFKCLCMFLSLSIDEIDESAEMRMSIP